VDFTARQRAALLSIADTLVPGDPTTGVPGPAEVGLVDTVARMAEHKLLPRERRDLALFLSAWDTPLMGPAHGLGPRRFSAQSRARRERALLAWGDSAVAAKRSIFQGIKSLVTAAYYIAPDAAAVRVGTGWPEAFGPPSGPTPPPLPTVPVPAAGLDLTADVVVVGSGAGGGVAAAVLARAGLDVLVLERGPQVTEADFGGGELDALTGLYAGAPATTVEGQLTLMAGGCLGGGTVVNWTTALATPDGVRAEWAEHGLPHFTGSEFDAAQAAVQRRLSVNTEQSAPSGRDTVLQRGLTALGWDCAPLPRNVVGCDQGVECGRCGYGCRLGAKQSVAKTWLADAVADGARLVTGVDVRTVRVGAGRATGVHAIGPDGAAVRVRARALVVSAGAIQTPALLRRSGLRNPNIGRHLRLHPATAVAGVFDEPVRPWEGTLQARVGTVHADLDGAGYGVLYETGPMSPGAAMIFQPWHGAAAHRADLVDLAHTAAVGVILRDRDAGSVTVGRNGEPVVHYRLSDRDAAHLHRGVVGAAQILAAAGARRLRSAHQTRVAVDSGPIDATALNGFAAAAAAQGYAPARCLLAALHLMGSARMGGNPDRSAVNPDGGCWEVPNLVVADGSCFPTASGVNPMISIETIAHINAARLAATLG
jgi:long-chain-alcohol oxidase